ncbi:MAG: T9SS type A sorting domain-containing protein [Bacteroidetes bacterium]|nr:T9SS type A sorting domain-containing protein [Bacteroidota bacterium]
MRGLKEILILITFIFCFSCISHAEWVQQSNPTSSYMYNNFFLNSNTGWACGGRIIKTTDGGANWANLDNPSANNLESIYFIDANTGFLCGHEFYRTTNGGTNWVSISVPGTFFGRVYFTNSLTGWLAAGTGIYRTTNAGINWANISSAETTNLWSLFFLNSNTGWITSASGKIFKTTNAGTNWVSQTSGTTSPLVDINFIDANTGKACGWNGIFLRTSNGGSNWESVSTPVSSSIDHLAFINSSTGWISGNSGVVFTTDNGTNWINITPAGAPNGISGLSYASPGILYYTTTTNIYKSTNGGFNLTAPSNLTATPVSAAKINLSWTDNSANEDKFMIERSTDGSSWTLLDSVNTGTTTYSNTGLTFNTTYYYKVYCKKLSYSGGYSGIASAFTFLNAPALSSPANNYSQSNYTPTFTWAASTFASTYFLQVATDTNFSNIVYSTSGAGLLSQAMPGGILQNSTKYYWRVKCANDTNQSLYSSYRILVMQDPNYGNNIMSGNSLYYFANSTAGANLSPSQPSYNWKDTTGSINLIVNGTAQIPVSSGTADDGRFDIPNILTGSNAVRFFGVNYQNLYIGTNGITAFTSFTPEGPELYQPSYFGLLNTAIYNAIFPLWKDLNFADTTVHGSRLCYKVTSNEIIITYMKAPTFNTVLDANDYVSFQLVIEYSDSPSTNSRITFMYNYIETGSTFISKYNVNTLSPTLIGINGGNSLAQRLQYRFLNYDSVLVNSGPMFGSNLALQLGPDENLLPVELSSFTATVNGSNVKLNWSTVSELSNSRFDIERKISGSNDWKRVSHVNGNGTTNQVKSYFYEDKNLAPGKYQYRIKQIDYNGNFEYHNLASEVVIGVPNKFSLLQNYPNPFNPVTVISYQLPVDGFVSIKVYDMAGKEVMSLLNSNQNAGYHTVEFTGTSLASGTYFYTMQAGDFKAVKKMVLIK